MITFWESETQTIKTVKYTLVDGKYTKVEIEREEDTILAFYLPRGVVNYKLSTGLYSGVVAPVDHEDMKHITEIVTKYLEEVKKIEGTDNNNPA